MPEPERSIEELVDSIAGDCEHMAYSVAQHRREKSDCDSPTCTEVRTLLRAVDRLREYATHLPECATRHPRPADAPENQCSCGFAALTPKGGDRE